MNERERMETINEARARLAKINEARAHMRTARKLLREVKARMAAQAVARALKSVDGAHRHALGKSCR